MDADGARKVLRRTAQKMAEDGKIPEAASFLRDLANIEDDRALAAALGALAQAGRKIADAAGGTDPDDLPGPPPGNLRWN